MSRVTVHHGDSRDVLKTLADASVDSVVCDPPYALVSVVQRFGNSPRSETTENIPNPYGRTGRGFMGQKWDTGETAFDPAFWVEVKRVLKPGGHLIAFSGTRTYHRLACAIEDAGFEMRDMIAWLYGSGFPKSHNVSKSIDKAAGATREVVSEGKAVKRMIPGADQNAVGWEKNDGREFVPTVTVAATPEAATWEGWGTALKPALEPIVLARKPLQGTVAANVLAHGTGALNIDASRIGYDPDDTNPATNPLHRKQAGYANSNAADTGSSSYSLKDGSGERNPNSAGRWPANVIHDGSAEVIDAFPTTMPSTIGKPRGAASGDGWGMTKTGAEYADAGSAARFFYSSKADAEDRCGSKHPTVKPIDLMAYLCRLVTRPGGLVLDPFAGSGSTGMACLREGFDCILIEREAQYVADIHARLAHVEGADTPLFAGAAA